MSSVSETLILERKKNPHTLLIFCICSKDISIHPCQDLIVFFILLFYCLTSFQLLMIFFFPVHVFLLQMCVLLFANSQCFAIYPATLGSFQGVLYKIKDNSDDVYSTSPWQFQEHHKRRYREAGDRGICLCVRVLSIKWHKPASLIFSA